MDYYAFYSHYLAFNLLKIINNYPFLVKNRKSKARP